MTAFWALFILWCSFGFMLTSYAHLREDKNGFADSTFWTLFTMLLVCPVGIPLGTLWIIMDDYNEKRGN